MRIRTIKPEFWANEKLSEVSESAHMLAAALLNYCDDEGYFNANPKLIKAALYPIREPSVNIHGMLTELSNIDYLRLGKGEDGRTYGYIVNFTDHQKINRPSISKIKDLADFHEYSVNIHGAISVGSLSEQGTGNREGNVEHGECKRTPKKKKTANHKLTHKTTITFVEIFNEVFNRKIRSIGIIDKRVRELLADGYDDWKILIMPIIQQAIDPNTGTTRNFDPLMLLRTGEHGRTGENGATYGKTDWIQRAHGNADKFYADARLSKIAYKYGLADILDWMMKGIVKNADNQIPQMLVPGMVSANSRAGDRQGILPSGVDENRQVGDKIGEMQ